MKKVIQIGENAYQLRFDEFDEEMDIDALLRIDYTNLIGEMVTFPVIVNRFGNMLAEAESKVAEVKLNIDILEAKLKERLRIELSEANGGKNPTVDALNNSILLDKAYQVMRKKYVETQKQRDYINSIFWSCKDKSDKISILVKSSDITMNTDLSEAKINNVLVKKRENLIK